MRDRVLALEPALRRGAGLRELLTGRRRMGGFDRLGPGWFGGESAFALSDDDELWMGN